MGFNVTALAQKARTQTLIVDSDLDMGQYDVIATDVKGDTAEFDEFVGGVGNFTNGLFSGGLDVSGILHAESTMQIDDDLVIDGSINNVNITAEGAITTAKSITATGGFKGNLTGNVTGSISGGTVAGSTGTFSGTINANGGIKGKSYTVTQGSTTISMQTKSPYGGGCSLVLLSSPYDTYTGSLTVTASAGVTCNLNVAAYNTFTGYSVYVHGNESSNSTATISFANANNVVASVTINADSWNTTGTIKYNNIILS